jgi:hypothetical protein
MTNLFKRFNMTEEGFRTKFRGSKIEKGEIPTQYLVRLENYLGNWMSQAGAELHFKRFKDLVLREQFLNSSNKQLQLFLKERKFKAVQDMAEVADIYMEAHEGQKIGHNNELQSTVCFICQGNHYKRDCPNLRPQNTAALVHKG